MIISGPTIVKNRFHDDFLFPPRKASTMGKWRLGSERKERKGKIDGGEQRIDGR